MGTGVKGVRLGWKRQIAQLDDSVNLLTSCAKGFLAFLISFLIVYKKFSKGKQENKSRGPNRKTSLGRWIRQCTLNVIKCPPYNFGHSRTKWRNSISLKVLYLWQVEADDRIFKQATWKTIKCSYNGSGNTPFKMMGPVYRSTWRSSVAFHRGSSSSGRGFLANSKVMKRRRATSLLVSSATASWVIRFCSVSRLS